MKRLTPYILIFVAVIFSACNRNAITPTPGLEDGDIIPISFSLSEVEGLETKALIGSDPNDADKEDDGDYMSLEDACAVGEGKRGKEHAICAELILGEGDHASVMYDIFNTTGNPSTLYYSTSDVDGVGGTKTKWEYKGDKRYWVKGAHYNFVALYPSTIYENIDRGSSTVAPNTFVLEMNTHKVQEDVLYAYNEVLTNDPVKVGWSSIYHHHPSDKTEHVYSFMTTSLNIDPDSEDIVKREVSEEAKDAYTGSYGLSERFYLTDPVPLHFQHAMAAIQVRIKFDYEDNNKLVRCWFENTDNKNGFHTNGFFLMGLGAETAPEESKNWSTYNRKEWEHPTKDKSRWLTSQTDFVGQKFYPWGVQDPTTDGISFTMTEAAIAYSNTADQIIYADTGNTKVKGTTPLNLKKTGASTYGENKGWLFVPEQKSTGNLKFCYSLASAPDDYTEVMIPLNTLTDSEGRLKGETYVDYNGVTQTVQEADCIYYVSGHRYVYTITIQKTDVFASVQILPWKELNSSTEIPF